MSLVVQGLGYCYGSHRALESLGFTAQAGRIVGLLGPNGAGKSTTMKLLSTQLLPPVGTVQVHGYDAALHTRRVRRLTGYLPEHNPLYEDMYVRAFLQFMGRLYGLGRAEAKRQVQALIALCGLEAVQGQLIRTLSRGYKQRLGIARVYMHKPQVLLLDEPTAGLDPNQLRDIRALLSRWSETCTILLSTHVLQEVEALCDHVVLIHQGRIVADQRLAAFKRQHVSTKILHLSFAADIDLRRLDSIADILRVESLGGGSYHLHTPSDTDLRPQLLAWAQEEKLPLLGLDIVEPSLEHIFHALTKKT